MPFTISAAARYGVRVLLMLAAIALAAPLPPATPREPIEPRVQARATIRVLAGFTVDYRQASGGDGFVARDTIIRSAAGEQPARLLEFQ